MASFTNDLCEGEARKCRHAHRTFSRCPGMRTHESRALGQAWGASVSGCRGSTPLEPALKLKSRDSGAMRLPGAGENGGRQGLCSVLQRGCSPGASVLSVSFLNSHSRVEDRLDWKTCFAYFMRISLGHWPILLKQYALPRIKPRK